MTTQNTEIGAITLRSMRAKLDEAVAIARRKAARRTARRGGRSPSRSTLSRLPWRRIGYCKGSRP